MSTVAELQAELSVNVNPFVSDIRRAKLEWDGFSDNFSSFSVRTSGISTAMIATGVVIGNVATSIVSHLSSMASSALSSGVSFLKMKEQATTAFTNLFQSAEKAKGFISELAAFANKTPFEMPELVKAAQKFTAMGFSAKEVIPILTSVGNAVAAMGGSSQQIDRVTTALVQMKAKGKVSAQEMMQLAEAGIPAWQILAEKIGKSIPEAMKLGEKGALSASMAIEALVEGMDARFGGMMEKQSRTFSGLMSTISDTSQQVLGNILEPLFVSATGAMQVFVDLLPDVQKGIEGMTEQTKLAAVAFTGLALATGAAATAIAVTIGGPAALAVAGLGIQVAAVTAAILSNFGQIGSAIAAWTGDTQINFSTVLKWIGMGADGFAMFARGVLVGVDMIGTALVVMGKAFMGAISMLQGFATSAKGVLTFDPTQIVTGIAQMQGAWTKFDVGVSTQIRAFNQRLKTNLQDTVDNINGKYANGFQSAGVKISGAFTKAANSVQEYVGKVEGLVKKGQAATEGVMGAGGAKKGKDDTEKILKEQLDFVNDWVKQTEFAVTLNLAVWKKLGPGVKETLLEASAAFRQSINNAQTWAASLQAAFINAAKGDLGKSLIVKLKGTKILIENPTIEVGADFANKIAMGNLLKEIPRIKITPEILKQAEDFKEAQQRTLDDWVRIQVKAHDTAIAEQVKFDAAMRTIIANENTKRNEAHRRAYEELSNIVGDGLATILAATTAGLGGNLSTVKSWASDITKIISVLPESFQRTVDKVLQTINKWVEFGNGVLGVLKKLGFDVPATMGDLIQGMIKKLDFSDALSKVKDFGSKMLESLKSSMGKVGGILAGAGLLVGSQFAPNKGVGVAMGAGGGALAGFMIGGPLGAAIGGVAGGLFGLFGGKKSKEQSAAEKQAKEQAALNTQGLINSVNQGIIETMQKGAELLKTIEGHVDVPRKAIQRFINQLGLVLTEFTEMSKQFKSESLTAGKAVVDNLGGAFEFLFGGAELINAIKNVASITEQNISDFVSTVVKIAQKWGEAADGIALQTAKFTGKISDKLRTSFEFLGIVPDVIKGFAESVSLDDSKLDSAFTTAQKIVQKMKELSEAERGLELNKAGASAGIFATIFETLKGMMDAFTSLSSYKPLEDTILNKISSDLQKLIDWGASLTSMADKGTLQFDTLQASLSKFGSSIRTAVSGLSGLQPASSSITASIVRQDGAQFATRQGASPSVYNVTNNFNQTFNASSEDALVRRIRDEVRKEVQTLSRDLSLRSMSS